MKCSCVNNVSSGVETTLYLSQQPAVLNTSLPALGSHSLFSIYHTATPHSQSPVSTTAASTHHSQSSLQSPQYKYTCVLGRLHNRPNVGREYYACRSALSVIRCPKFVPLHPNLLLPPRFSLFLDSRSSSIPVRACVLLLSLFL